MKKYLSLIALVFVLTACSDQTGDSSSDVNTINLNNIQDLQGKPSMIIWASTNCPHCHDEVPRVEKQIYTPMKDEVNVVINSVDRKAFDTNIPQDLSPRVMFQDITGEKCRYVPTWAIVDSKGELLDAKCGTSGQVDIPKQMLQNLLPEDKKAKSEEEPENQTGSVSEVDSSATGESATGTEA